MAAAMLLISRGAGVLANHSEGPVATHGPGEFTGEMIMISGRRCLVRGRVTEPGVFVT